MRPPTRRSTIERTNSCVRILQGLRPRHLSPHRQTRLPSPGEVGEVHGSQQRLSGGRNAAVHSQTVWRVGRPLSLRALFGEAARSTACAARLHRGADQRSYSSMDERAVGSENGSFHLPANDQSIFQGDSQVEARSSLLKIFPNLL